MCWLSPLKYCGERFKGEQRVITVFNLSIGNLSEGNDNAAR